MVPLSAVHDTRNASIFSVDADGFAHGVLPATGLFQRVAVGRTGTTNKPRVSGLMQRTAGCVIIRPALITLRDMRGVVYAP
jgi:hypothetical protein